MDKEGENFLLSLMNCEKIFTHFKFRVSKTGEKVPRLLICLTDGSRNLLSIALSYMEKPFR